MAHLQEIHTLAEQLLEKEDPRLQPICAAVYEMLLACLRSGVSEDDCSEAFVMAGALYSLSMLKDLDDLGLSAFDAGALKLNFRENSGDSLSRMAQRILSPWCGDDFAFRGVSG